MIKKTSSNTKGAAKGVWSVKTGAAKTTPRTACRDILAPTKKSTLGRARIKAAVAKVYGQSKKSS